MQRVAALFLPHWPIERLWRAERRAGARLEPARGAPATIPASLDPLREAVAGEQEHACSVPRGGGWRPGARWARDGAGSANIPRHQRPARHEVGRREEPAPPPFRATRPDEGGVPIRASLPNAAPLLPGHAAPLITRIQQGNQLVIAAACPVAQALGLKPGMPVTQARVQVRGLDIRVADPEGDMTALKRLAILAARRWSPLVALSGEDTLFLDLTGASHLFGGEQAMARHIVRLLARAGFTARIAIAGTPGAAWALAHFAVRHPRESVGPSPALSSALHGEEMGPRFRGDDGMRVCAPGEEAAALANLPTPALRIDEAAIELLRRLGIDRVGQLAALPRAPLVRRFGNRIVLRLDQAMGHIAEPLDPVIPPEAIAVRQRFAEPIATAEAIEHWLGVLTPKLAAALEQEALGARALECVADRIDGVPQRIRIGLARPNRDAAHLLRLLRRRIEDVEPGYGIDALALHVRRAQPLAPQPLVERLDEETAPDLAELVDTLATRIGPAAMWRMRPVESDIPERAVTRMPVLDAPERGGTRPRIDDVNQLDRNPALHPWHPAWPKPVRLLRRPERIDHVLAELPDHAPRRFSWRGRSHTIVHADGPERIHGEWWKRDAERDSIRDYFRVEDEAGRRYWLFRHGDGERTATGDLSWYLHGVFG